MSDDAKESPSREESAVGEIREATEKIERAAREIRKKADESLTGGGYQSSGGTDAIPPGERDHDED